MTKGMAAMLVYTTKECNYHSIVIVHQHGGYDVTCKQRNSSSKIEHFRRGLIHLIHTPTEHEFAMVLNFKFGT